MESMQSTRSIDKYCVPRIILVWRYTFRRFRPFTLHDSLFTPQLAHTAFALRSRMVNLLGDRSERSARAIGVINVLAARRQ